jgi:hypothetical protein
MSLEIEYTNELKLQLAPFGNVSIEYITAETQPFSSQQRPDVLFSPFSGAYRNTLIFIEVKLSTKAVLLGHFVPAILEKRAFAADALERPVARYVYVSAADVPEHCRKLLENENIIVVAPAQIAYDVICELSDRHVISIPK